ncbi:LysE family translocator [Thalassotalea sp. M1531]|uniref:LysE family translocator n=1 Tax=Thalassotalea algicola TaxID=2716224 RepID=A0A7Y0Q6D4_9GAMM|nr:LysE family translocator [Thalassotalea algicola]NMP31056.1 LysE family translocator [Thalassotalea algicola]
MAFEIWISFLAASLLLCFSPGPTVFLVIAQALEQGKKSVLPLVLGTLSGDVIAMTFSFLGMGAILATSATLFYVLKWAGALYLIYLGFKAFRSKASSSGEQLKPIKKGSVYVSALIVTALNPKGIIFFMAFFPLFIDANSPLLPQMLIMSTTFLFVSTISVSTYTLFSAVLRNKVSSIKFQNTFNKLSGGMLVSAGLVTASLKHNG